MSRGKGLMMITWPLLVFLIGSSARVSQPNEDLPQPRVTLIRMAGDTLVYKADWGRATNASGYLLALRSSTSGWSATPTGRVLSDTTTVLKPYKVGWDSTTFRLVVWATNGSLKSKDSSWVSWKVTKLPGTPGPIKLDSSQVIGLKLLPEGLGDIQQLTNHTVCAYGLNKDDNKWAFATGQSSIEKCQQLYLTFPITQRYAMYVENTTIKLAMR